MVHMQNNHLQVAFILNQKRLQKLQKMIAFLGANICKERVMSHLHSNEQKKTQIDQTYTLPEASILEIWRNKVWIGANTSSKTPK